MYTSVTMRNPFHAAESSSPVRVSSPDPQLSSYGMSPTDYSPESSRKLQETFSLEFSGRIDEEPPDTVEDETGDTGPIEILLPDEKESLENKLPNMSRDSLEPPQESHLPESGSHNEQGEAVEQVAEVPVVASEEPLVVRTERHSSLEDSHDSIEKPPDLKSFDSAQDHSHRQEPSEELGEPPPTQGEEAERLSEEEVEEKEEEEEEEEEEEKVGGEEQEAQGVGGGEESEARQEQQDQQDQQDYGRPGKEDVEEEDEERYVCVIDSRPQLHLHSTR